MKKFSLLSGFLQGRSPGQLIIQLTDRCNAQCPQCSMRVSNNFKRTTLGIDQCGEIIDRAAERGVMALSLTGGEPFLYPKEVASLITHAGKAGIEFTRTGTNGFMFKNPESPDFLDRVKRTVGLLAGTPLRNFWISIDSADPHTHENMRGFPGMIKGIEKALPIFHAHGLYPTANLGINRNLGGAEANGFSRGIEPVDEGDAERYKEDVKSGLREFFGRVRDLGFTLVNFCYPMSIEKNEKGLEAVYPANSVERIVRFTDLEKSLIFSALLETIPAWRDQLRIFSPLSALHSLKQVYSGAAIEPFPCRGGLDHFFINARDGNTYPCGYRGKDNLGDYQTTQLTISDRSACTRCDWECFRDPSELMGPLSKGLRNPLSLMGRYRRDSEYYRLWFRDLKYYQSCQLFDGRSDIKQDALKKHCSAPPEKEFPIREIQPSSTKQLNDPVREM